MDAKSISRRSVLGAIGAAGLSAASPMLSGCSNASGGTDSPSRGRSQASSIGGAGSTRSSASANPSSVLPAFVAKQAAPPDLPGDANGTPDAYLAYPKNPVREYTSPPMSGGSVNILKLVSVAVPPALDKNQFWQQLNKRVGAELKINNVIVSDYPAKAATTIAGGDLPDLMQMSVSFVPHLADALTKEFQDLSPWLSGASASDYPYLAALPTISWRNVVFNNKIYGIPYPLGTVGADNKIRQDVVDKLGLSIDLTDGDDFTALCKGLTSAKDRRWALGTIASAQTMVNEMLGVPNAYRVANGKFVRDVQTDEYQQALGVCAKFWESGYIYPDSLSSTAGLQQWFTGGQVMTQCDGYTNWQALTAAGVTADAKFQIGGLVLPKWDGGGQAPHYVGNGMYTFTVMKKADDSRVAELLKMLNWFATPFGTEEYLFKKWGIPGRDYTLNGTDPAETKTGVTECQQMNTPYIASAPQPLYVPGYPEVIKADHGYLTNLMKVTAPLPTVGLISETQLAKGASLDKTLIDAATDIVVGRKPLSSWGATVKAYLSAGGDQINDEYSAQYASVGGN